MTLIKKTLFIILFGFISFCSNADEIELLNYQSFNKHGDHSFLVNLPDGANYTRKQFVEIELGCAQQGCSDWDYTVRFEWIKDGHKYELGRLITPYAGYMQRGMHGFNRNWTRKYIFDVSHLAPVLQGEGILNAHYGGWGAKKSAFGFSAKLVYGTAVTRKVQRVIPIYYSKPAGWPYKTADEFAAFLPDVPVEFLANELSAELKVIVSAHGHALSFDNPTNEPELCGEWCERFFDVKVNDALLERTSLWRADCDQSATFPQGGTYIYARANWCPGEIVDDFTYRINTQQANSSVDIDWQTFSWQSSEYGKGAPHYIISAVLVTYGSQQVNTDLSLESILSPNKELASRNNQSCSDVTVNVLNQGQTLIEEIDFTYGVIGQQQHTFSWQGALLPNERQTITLPAKYWGSFIPSESVFNVQANALFDERSSNNIAQSRFDPPKMLTDQSYLNLLTGKVPEETTVLVRDRDGEIVKQWQQFTASTEHRLNLDLPLGCYQLEILDSAKDGLAFPFLNSKKGKGAIAIHDRKSSDAQLDVHSLQADFGRRLILPFTLGYSLGKCPASPWQRQKAYSEPGEEVSYLGVIYRSRHWSYNFQPDNSGPYDAWQAVSYCDGSVL